MTKDGREYLVQTDSLEQGRIDPLQGALVIPPRHFYSLIAKDGYYYYLDATKSALIKCSLRGHTFAPVASVPLEGFSMIENFTWLSPDSLLLIGFDFEASITRFARVDVNQLSAEEGLVDIPPPFGPFNWMSIGFTKLNQDRFLIGYTYHSAREPGSYSTIDTITVDVLSYPSMKSLARYKDTRSAYPGGINTQQSYSFTDEKGDFYFVACPGIIAGNNPDKPTGIFRIRDGEERPDPGYFFNISASEIDNHGYGFWYIGKGRAIIRTERKKLYTSIQDHYKVPHFDFYVLNLERQTTTRLDLPLDKGSSRQCVLVEDGNVYITVNSDTDGCYVWLLDPVTLSLKKGLQFTGETDYILRLDRL